MARYYVNDTAQASSGDHEVHRQGCTWMPNPENRTYLGDFETCYPAVRAAKRIYPNADGCYWCSRDCHTG